MTTSVIYDQEVTADVAAYAFRGGGNVGEDLVTFAIKMRTHTAESLPGFGTLLATIDYFDGDNRQQLNISINLSAGNFTTTTWPGLWIDRSQDVTLQFQYIGVGGVDGSADVKIIADGV